MLSKAGIQCFDGVLTPNKDTMGRVVNFGASYTGRPAGSTIVVLNFDTGRRETYLYCLWEKA